jgi:tetratricopeptide (TPR) repeat protein
LPIDEPAPAEDDTTLHITRELLQAIREGRIPPRALVVIGLEHLRSVCPHCREEIDRDLEDRRRVVYAGAEGFDATFRNLEEILEHHAAELDEAGQRAEVLFAEVLAVPTAERLKHVKAYMTHYGDGLLARRLIDAARQATPGEPEKVRSFAQCAFAICEQLSNQVSDRGGMMAEAVCLLGNAERVLGEFEQARVLFRLAQSTLGEQGVTDPLVYAEMDSFRASLARDVGQLKEAARLAARAAVVYAGLAEVELAAKCGIQLGYIHYQAGEYKESLRASERAIRHLDWERDTRLVWCARHNQTLCLLELGEMVEASRHFEEDQPLYAAFSDAGTRLRRDWLEGRVLARSKPQEAVRLLKDARRGFLLEHSVYDSVLVSLDLGQLLLQTGQSADLEGLAAQLSEVLQAEGACLAAETLAIMRAVLATISGGAATVRLLSEAAARMRRRGRLVDTTRSTN